ncbi:MAG: CDP-diacylglycerol--glycerol-3-phosphate 3-phosphatidyltransferase [Pseudomonadota bacterium]
MSAAVRERKFAFSLPNILTYGRIAAIGLIVIVYALSADFTNDANARLIAAVVFLVASATDYFDGYYARKWDMGTAMGKMLDPIADKMLVAVVLLILCADGTIAGWQILAPALILCREFLVSGLRELAGGAKGVTSVTQLAKWKTTVQLVSLLLLLAGSALGAFVIEIGLVLLWASAALTLFTGYDYFTKTMAYLTRDEA